MMENCLFQNFRTSGDILLEAVRQVEPGVAIGKILIQGLNSMH